MSDSQKKPPRRRLYQNDDTEDVLLDGDSPASSAEDSASTRQHSQRAGQTEVKEGELLSADGPSPVLAAEAAYRIASERELALRRCAEDIVREHALLAGATMAIPIPLLDTVAGFAIQLKLVKRLSELYSVDFSEHRARALLAASIAGISTGWAAGSALTAVSLASYFTSFVPSAVVASGLTYALGHVFITHFENAGTLDDLEARQIVDAVARQQAMRTRTV
ncbi:YcjF family protein [Parachitinimonas caeni]|uniref:YcjF family protein n=1 Tax=Parachitinimonas caeni TaxID=3031301 RepID=A0ABT7E1E4_9NEIS|nr:YcjF family protein [Parachitinimonas caeni]MDK2126140.1 YcjF family protein [Parachitinimonas caeni]